MISHMQLLEKHNWITIITVDYHCNYVLKYLHFFTYYNTTEASIVSWILPRQRNVNENILLTRREVI